LTKSVQNSYFQIRYFYNYKYNKVMDNNVMMGSLLIKTLNDKGGRYHKNISYLLNKVFILLSYYLWWNKII